MEIVEKTVKEIKALKIQGASNVRKMAVLALLKSAQKSRAKSEGEFRKEFLHNAQALFSARPTEPELRTALRILKKSISQKELTIGEMKEKIIESAKEYENNRKEAMKLISDFASELIEGNSTILTHCHSSSVVNALISAKKKIRQVYCCEARPLYQGRLTARDLSKAGIKTTLIVDNAASTIAKKCDYFFTGADALLADGDVVNKIGTNQVSTICKKYQVPHYVCASTHKFEPATFFGKTEPIEERSAEEVWEKKLRGKVNIYNPAFDRTDSTCVEGIVCEIGIFPPEAFASMMYKRLDLKKHHEDFLKL